MKDLSLQHLLTKEFKHKIQHLYDNFKTILSENYENNEEITATFHIEKSSGLGEGSRIDKAITEAIKDKFSDLVDNKQYSLKFVIRKQDGVVVNEPEFRAYVASVVFYLVMFNAFVFIGDKDNGFTLFASQRKIYNNDYITGLYSNKLPSSTKLSQTGEQIYNTWQAQWNEENGNIIWNLEDCWPIFLLDDAKDLIAVFKLGFNVDIKELT